MDIQANIESGYLQDATLGESRQIVKRTIKDSVFTNLFGDRKYLIQLYRALHPEDASRTEKDLQDITIRNVLTDNPYNDLGFMVGDVLLILVEAQSTWSENIIIRALMYLMQTYNEYFKTRKINLYSRTKVEMPKPEMYVIFTGERSIKPEYISLSEAFFSGQDAGIDAKVKVIYDGKKGDIINQYVTFAKVCDQQVALYGKTRKAILETIRICKDQNVLLEYLKSREKEVVDIMITLYDEQEVMERYIESEIARKVDQEVARKVDQEVGRAVAREADNSKKTVALRMIEAGKYMMEEIAAISGLSLAEVEALSRA